MDFQTYGKGLASNDFAQLINWSYDTRSYEEVDEFSTCNTDFMFDLNAIFSNVSDYHVNLCLNGVKDYHFEDFLTDVKIALSVIGEEKAQDFLKLIENGMFVKPMLVLTSLYVEDKDNFLIVKD